MRVLITTDSFPPACGGSGWSTFELARALRARGHEVEIEHLRPGRRGVATRQYEEFRVEEQGVAAPRVPFVRNYFKNERSYRRLVPILRARVERGRFDIVHAQHVLSAPPSVEAARLAGVPAVCTIRDYWPVCYWSDLILDPRSVVPLCPACSPAMMRRCLRPRAGSAWPLALPLVPYMTANLRRKQAAMARADAVVAVSSVLARDLAARVPSLAGTRLETIPNPVDVDLIVRGARPDHPLGGRPYAVYAGKLAHNKGVSALVPAAERARLPWPLVVIGDGPDRPIVERAASEAGRDVRILGWLERGETLNWLAHASLVVFPSYGPESLSRVLLESSALGRPIAAMDTGGTRDIVIDGETGLLATDSNSLGDAIARLVADPALAHALGDRAATTIRERFDGPRVGARIEALYADLIERRAGTSSGASPALPATPAVSAPRRRTIAILARACYPLHGHGGLERHVYDLVHHLLARDVSVRLVTPPDRSPSDSTGRRSDEDERARRVFQDPRCVRHTVPYVTFPLAGRRGTTVIDRCTAYPLFGLRAGRLAADLVRAGKVDIVYGLGASALGYAHARTEGCAAPFVFNPQGLEEFGATGPGHAGGWLKHAAYAPLRRAVRACAHSADCVIATDAVLEPTVRRHLDVGADRIRVVPNGIDVEACDRLASQDDGRRIKAQFGIADDEAVLLSVGRLERNKGFHVLARALGLLRQRAGRNPPRDRFRWVLVGDGPYRSTIVAAVDAAGLRDRVLFAGRASEADLHAWYESATLFVHPTLYEGSSLVTLEAMAHHRAVVATTAGGLPDKVAPGVTGWLVPPGDADALADALHEALASDRLDAMGREGRALVERRFSWPAVADDFLRLCEELLTPAPGAARLP